MNAELRLAIQKAKDNNMPNDNIERAIKRHRDMKESVPSGLYGATVRAELLYMEIMSDNRNRTASE